MIKYNFNEIKQLLYNKYGLIYLYGDFNGIKSYLYCKDKDDFIYFCNIQKMIYKGTKSKIVHPKNKYSIYNINHFLKINGNSDFLYISKEYMNNNSLLKFKHLKCGNTFENKWINICRGRYRNNIGENKTGLFCPFCEPKKMESVHATVLKQIWLHEQNDTIVEDPSCINKNTKHILPTDIVNHRLKIAIEIQSWFHDSAIQKNKDEIKKKFWVDKGYRYFAVDQRDYTVLEMVQIFFPYIAKIPEYVDISYSNTFDTIAAQKLLDKYKSIKIVSEIMNCTEHKIYDSIYGNRMVYPDGYVNCCYREVVQLDLNFNYIKEFKSISSAEKETNVNGISNALLNGRNYCGGYYWVDKNAYTSGNYTIKKTKLKNKKS